MKLVNGLFALSMLSLLACGPDKNQVLYNQVMDIHDEVMPVTEDLYNITKGLKAQLKETTVDSVKIDLKERIRYVDSVNTMMMDWMRKFKPQPENTNKDSVRVYYERELVKIKLVKEAMLSAREKFAALPTEGD